MTFDIEGSYEPPCGWSIHDLAVDAVRGGHVREGRGLSSVQGESDMCLCAKCTNKVDAFVTEDRGATDDEIERALSNDRI